MSLKVFGFFVVIMALASPSSIYAQDTSKVTFLIGLIGAYNFVSYNSAAFPILNEVPQFFLAQNGTGHDPSFGISGEFPLSSDMHDFFVIEALYDSKSANFNTIYVPHPDTTINITSVNLAATLRYILTLP